ncbi:thiol-disulfide oxidoreductase ResA [Evansella cellulosilytica]|uniref:Alkyl hydroperoxide reductase/ Thiol specific antioxidant/ Mal allergen n=1 Tax=Evansella cellulosilytica (strain ATCC 21833 / DSM 2522 / FERM P-1141 / JCM 9156 / N-4) TaxID=649639 RepID=E6TYN3_EVAC2|nr:thiol-disulfide oxidoreductase ResA [Evansella cellulosilytica]ADU30083.1 alkyl hydroperoxide reductase/ Thiol specific antioxidant/ Mal allergen [Evansella cellulosilytica DSM 2522]
MKQRRLIIRSLILLVMIVAIIYTMYNHLSDERGLVDSGDIAPNFRVVDLDENILELDELRGKGVYVNFWATYCRFCREKMQYLRDHYDEYKEKGVEIVSINVDESSVQVENHQNRFNLHYPLYIDRSMLISDAYGVISLPATFLIDENGIVVERHIGGKSEEQVIASLDKIIPTGEN